MITLFSVSLPHSVYNHFPFFFSPQYILLNFLFSGLVALKYPWPVNTLQFFCGFITFHIPKLQQSKNQNTLKQK